VDLSVEVAAGRFREDLLFRLNTIEIRLPPLRERPEDIRTLAEHLLRRYTTRYRKPLVGFDPDALRALENHRWPGNVRELDHTIERAALLAHGGRVQTADLGLRAAGPTSTVTEDMPLEDVERLLIRKALDRHGGNVSQAAKALGLSRSALYRRLQHHGF
jgi:DNA-binding NtrC family response regulator